MTLNPRDRKSWQGFLDLMQPPQGYRLQAAIGTSFGLSLEALTAALLGMTDVDGEALATEPVAGVMAVTRLQSKVRVLVHPGTIAGHAGANKFVALLDRMIVEVKPVRGLFHPKVWALRFERREHSRSTPESIGRLIVSSRNLAPSTSFELGAVFEGYSVGSGETASPFSVDVAGALQAWLSFAKTRVPKDVERLPAFIRTLSLETPREAEEELRLRWQGQGRQPLLNAIPGRIKRAVVVSPFVRSDFVSTLLDRTERLQLVSTQESLDGLDDDTFSRLQALGASQGTPALYQVTDLGDPDEGHIDGIHAKFALIEDHQGRTVTLVGSANATGPGWGLGVLTNVEAVVEMRPGIGLDRFVSDFLRETKAKTHPWVAEYDRATRDEVDSTLEAERKILAVIRQIAALKLNLSYTVHDQRLTLRCASPNDLRRHAAIADPSIQFAVAPLLLTEKPEAWRPLTDLSSGECRFEGVALDMVSAFVALRVRRRDPDLERTRLLLAGLEMSEADLDRRDDAVRDEIMATADPAAVLNALVRGLAHLGLTSSPAQREGGRGTATLQQIVGGATLERLLQAVAMEPGLILEMRLLLGPAGGPGLRQLCDDLEAVVHRVRAERVP